MPPKTNSKNGKPQSSSSAGSKAAKKAPAPASKKKSPPAPSAKKPPAAPKKPVAKKALPATTTSTVKKEAPEDDPAVPAASKPAPKASNAHTPSSSSSSPSAAVCLAFSKAAWAFDSARLEDMVNKGLIDVNAVLSNDTGRTALHEVMDTIEEDSYCDDEDHIENFEMSGDDDEDWVGASWADRRDAYYNYLEENDNYDNSQNSRKMKAAKALLELGADPMIADTAAGQTPLHVLCAVEDCDKVYNANNFADAAIAKLLVEKSSARGNDNGGGGGGSSPSLLLSAKDKYGRTALNLANCPAGLRQQGKERLIEALEAME